MNNNSPDRIEVKPGQEFIVTRRNFERGSSLEGTIGSRSSAKAQIIPGNHNDSNPDPQVVFDLDPDSSVPISLVLQGKFEPTPDGGMLIPRQTPPHKDSYSRSHQYEIAPAAEVEVNQH